MRNYHAFEYKRTHKSQYATFLLFLLALVIRVATDIIYINIQTELFPGSMQNMAYTFLKGCSDPSTL